MEKNEMSKTQSKVRQPPKEVLNLFFFMIFSWKGIGYEVFEALTKNDLPVVMGATLIFATIFVVTNIFVDIAYGVLDPRVRVK